MSRSWNGSALVTELSALLGDTSTAFQARVLGWLNDTINDVGSRHDWGFHKVKGKKKLASGTEEHSLEISAPGAPSVALSAGGSLTADSACYVLVTFAQANGVETIAGTASSSVTPTGANLTIDVTNIPVSTESLVTQRHLYLKQGTGKYYYHSTIFDNSTTTASIDEDTTDTTEPPDFDSIRKVSGNPFFEGSPSHRLIYKSEDQLRLMVEGTFSSGSPEFFTFKDVNAIVTYPIPSSTLDLSFNYYRNPFRLYNAEDSYPDLPINFKPILKAGVVALGYEYRDRAGQVEKRQTYENLLQTAITNYGRDAEVEYTVRDVYGSPDGFEVG
jgi:hypothetical protein